MKAWYIPAWNGDLRLEEDPRSDSKRTVLTIKKPTADEKRILVLLQEAFVEKGWITKDVAADMKSPSAWRETRHVINAPIVDVGPVVSSIVKSGPNVITGIRFKDGTIEVCETSKLATPEDEPGKPTKPSDESKALAKKKDAEAAATVKRPTPCCPDCYVDREAVNKPATEVLLSFLNEEEHEMWAKHRYIIANGGITGHRYLIAHRNSEIAQRNSRMTFDLDDEQVMHFHDWTVPPEEEVLATLLILKFREPWLRNEATALGNHSDVFKNPFGDVMDGVIDSGWTRSVGATLERVLDPARLIDDVVRAKRLRDVLNPGPQAVVSSAVESLADNGFVLMQTGSTSGMPVYELVRAED